MARNRPTDRLDASTRCEASETNAARRNRPSRASAAKLHMKSVFIAFTMRAPGAEAATCSLELPP